jgi:hypothetical protein
MTRKATGDLVRVEALKEPSGREMSALPIALGERVVRHLADERLDEGILATLWAARIGLDGENLATDERAEPGRQVVLIDPADGGKPSEGQLRGAEVAQAR